MDERVLRVLRRVSDGVSCDQEVPYPGCFVVYTCAFCGHGAREPYHYEDCEVLVANQVLDELEREEGPLP
jgi:hypothetical protein